MMREDPIIEELHQIRAERAAHFNYDSYAMLRDTIERQKRSNTQIVSIPRRRLPGFEEKVESEARLKSKLIMLIEQFLQRQMNTEQIGEQYFKVWNAYQNLQYQKGHQWEQRNQALINELREKGFVLDELFPVQWYTFWEKIPDKAFNQMVSDIDSISAVYHPVHGFPSDFDEDVFYQDILMIVSPPAELLEPPSMFFEEQEAYPVLEPAFA